MYLSRVMAMATFLMSGRLGTITGTVIFPALIDYGCLPPFITIGIVLAGKPRYITLYNQSLTLLLHCITEQVLGMESWVRFSDQARVLLYYKMVDTSSNFTCPDNDNIRVFRASMPQCVNSSFYKLKIGLSIANILMCASLISSFFSSKHTLSIKINSNK